MDRQWTGDYTCLVPIQMYSHTHTTVQCAPLYLSIPGWSSFTSLCIVTKITFSNIDRSRTCIFSRLATTPFYMQPTYAIINLCLYVSRVMDSRDPGDSGAPVLTKPAMPRLSNWGWRWRGCRGAGAMLAQMQWSEDLLQFQTPVQAHYLKFTFINLHFRIEPKHIPHPLVKRLARPSHACQSHILAVTMGGITTLSSHSTTMLNRYPFELTCSCTSPLWLIVPHFVSHM